MIIGRVVEGRPLVPVDIVIKGGTTRRIQAILDTGFDGDVALPNSDFVWLRSSPLPPRDPILAGGMRARFDRSLAMVEFDGHRQRVVAIDLGKGESDQELMPFVGMRLLRGYSVLVDVHEGGDVIIGRRDG